MNKVQDIVQIQLPQGAHEGFGDANAFDGAVTNGSNEAAMKEKMKRKQSVVSPAVETGPMGKKVSREEEEEADAP